MFQKILIANRGEIAVRVARTARKMNIRTVAVYSDADVQAMHVAVCDEAYRLGPPTPRESYLCADHILKIAFSTGAEAIHPGYGFLSENEDFASACQAAGIVFIGPSPAAIRAMGSKTEAKRLMEEAGVPLVSGYHGLNQDPAHLLAAAQKIGFPVLIKASAGGGGKGMKVASTEQEFFSQLESAKREAQSAFGDNLVLLERYLQEPRHIEIQIFADQLGNTIYLFERDCSIQRRHQKVIEEAPAPNISPQQRVTMGETAVKVAQKIGYVGAGTVEFIAESDGNFYFMEMNTRLQVEHPVTEMITGLDLVEWQLRVAAGQRLPLLQHELPLKGHALEARIYAEDPAKGFLPTIGRINCCIPPPLSDRVRLDTGIRMGDTITPYYDPMIAKLVVLGEDRRDALRRLDQALAEYYVTGLITNIPFLQRLINHPAFIEAQIDTGFIERYKETLLADHHAIPDMVYAFAALAELKQENDSPQQTLQNDPHSPWLDQTGWWLNQDNHREIIFQQASASEPLQTVTVSVYYRDQEVFVALPSGTYPASLTALVKPEATTNQIEPLSQWAFCWQKQHQHFSLVRNETERFIFFHRQMFHLRRVDPLTHVADSVEEKGHLRSPMPGTIIKVMVSAKEKVTIGQPLLVLEAMKMEHVIRAPFSGIVQQIFYQTGEQVSEGAELLDLTPSS